MAQANNWRDELASDEEEQNNNQDRDILRVSSLTPADTVELTFLSDGRSVETEFDNGTVQQFRVPVALEGVEGRALTADDVPAEAGEEYVILTAAKSIINPLAEFDDLEGETVRITSAGTGDYDGYEVSHD
jgi:hypothetical protein